MPSIPACFKALIGAALLWAVAGPSSACFQDDCTKPIPAPPQQQRLPLAAQILEPDAVSWGVHWGVNDKSSIAGQNEGSTYFRSSLGSSGIETVYGFATPMFIPYIDIRAQLLGYGWQHGPFLTLEAGGDLMPTRHIGLALGTKVGPLSPFVAASVGHSLDKDFIEGNAGLSLDLREQLSLNMSVSRRLNLADYGDVMADTLAVALDWHLSPGRGRAKGKRRMRRDEDADEDADGKAWPQPPAKTAAERGAEKMAATAATDDAAEKANPQIPAEDSVNRPASSSGDPCGFTATIDAFDPARWEARARCLDALGKPDDARQARAKAKELRAKDDEASPKD
jgi:hypothetical protein